MRMEGCLSYTLRHNCRFIHLNTLQHFMWILVHSQIHSKFVPRVYYFVILCEGMVWRCRCTDFEQLEDQVWPSRVSKTAKFAGLVAETNTSAFPRINSHNNYKRKVAICAIGNV